MSSYSVLIYYENNYRHQPLKSWSKNTPNLPVKMGQILLNYLQKF